MRRPVAWPVLAPAVTLACACGSTKIFPPIEGTPTDDAGDTSSSIVCGPGTSLVGSECTATPAPPSPTCGPGTEQVGAVCVAIPLDGGPPVDAGPTDGSLPLSCGPGTYEGDGGACLPLSSGGGCPSGSVNLGGTCIATEDGGDLSFAVRAPSSVPADGYSLAPVLALGPAPGGVGPAVVLAITPPLGALTTATLTLGPVGATTYYRPCDSTSPACAGSVRITMALASAPGTIVATSEPIALAPPTGVGSAAPCVGGGNVLFFDGDPGDYIHPGVATLSSGSWTPSAGTYEVAINMSPTGSSGTLWTLTFSSKQLGQALAAQVYTGAERAPFASPGSPGLEVYGDGRGCNTLSGSFQIEELEESDAGTLEGFTATFEQHCEQGTAALRGCVHYGQ